MVAIQPLLGRLAPVAVTPLGHKGQAQLAETRQTNPLVLFGQTHLGQTKGIRFITPHILENVPPFDTNDPQSHKLYHDLTLRAAKLARPAVSGRTVGMVLVGDSGRVYLGSNIEVMGGSPGDAIHGETFATVLARQNGEKAFKQVFVNAPMCGFCRQTVNDGGNFSAEIYNRFDVNTQRYAPMRPISDMLPDAYTNSTASVNILTHPQATVAVPTGKKHGPLTKKAIEAAQNSYARYPSTWGGVALQLKDGSVFTGSVVMISGHNPTIKPLQDAMVAMVNAEKAFDQIEKVVLVESKTPAYSYTDATKRVLRSIAPNASLRVVRLDDSTP